MGRTGRSISPGRLPVSIIGELTPQDQKHMLDTDSSSGSGGTHNSSSSGTQNDNSSASARFSSSSTLPSSSSLEESPDASPHAHPKQSHSLPVPPIPASQPSFFARSSRAFSFGRKASQAAQASEAAQNLVLATPSPQQNTTPVITPDPVYVSRPRGLTETSYASASTATPPKLLDADLGFVPSGDRDAFGDMFAGIGSSRAAVSRSPESFAVGDVVSNECRDIH